MAFPRHGLGLSNPILGIQKKTRDLAREGCLYGFNMVLYGLIWIIIG
jgi:hypothetical protein